MDRFDCFYRNDFGDEYPAFSKRAPDGDWYDAHDVDTEIARLIDERDGWEASSKAWQGTANRLTSQRDEAERTIGALKHLIGEQTDEIARLTRERDEAVRVAVWAANNVHGVMLGNRGRTEIHFWAPDGVPESVTCDGTDADIYRALREAMGASEGGGDGD